MPHASSHQLRAVVRRALTLALWNEGRASSDQALAVLPLATRGRGLELLAELRRLPFTHVWVAGGRPGRPDPVTGSQPAVLFSRAAAGGSETAREPAPLVASLDEGGLHPLNNVGPAPTTLGLLCAALTPRQAERSLRELTGEAVSALDALGLQRARSDLTGRLAQAGDLRAPIPRALPADLRAALDRAEAIADIVALGLADEGAAVTAAEAAARAHPLSLLADQAADVLVATANGYNLG